MVVDLSEKREEKAGSARKNNAGSEGDSKVREGADCAK